MLPPLRPLTLVFAAWHVAGAPHQAAAPCCFSLLAVSGSDVVPVNEGTNGDLRVDSDSEQASFCLNQENGLLQDGEGNNCFIQSVTKQFQCYSGVPSFNSFSLTPIADGSWQLAYDGRDSFRACSSWGSSDGSLELYSSEYEGEYCFDFTLLVQFYTGTCGLPETNREPDYFRSVRPDSTVDQPAAAAITQPIEERCNMTDDSPAIWPNRISTGVFGDQFELNPDGNGSISDTEATLFEFKMEPRDFPHHTAGGVRLCAVQFRFPYCSDLPAGYPCFAWSGMEQQRLSGGGMRFWHVYDTHTDVFWEPVDVVQLTPGEATFAGTFDCMVDNARLTNRNVSFIATGVRGWSLEFAQAGVGRQEAARDAVGAYVVGCGSHLDEAPPPRPMPSPL